MSFRTLVLAILALAHAASIATADPTWGSDASGELNGYRSSYNNGGIHATSAWDDGNFKIKWNITENNGLWTYVYTIKSDCKELSHWILEITDNGDFDTFNCTSDFEGPRSGWLGNPSNPGMPNDLYGIKFDAGENGNDDGLTQIYTIVTDRDPVYGVAYFKSGKHDGQNVVAWTNALSYADYKTNNLGIKNFIVRPDGDGNPPGPGGGGAAQVPEPTAALLLILGGSALALRGRHRRDAGL